MDKTPSIFDEIIADLDSRISACEQEEKFFAYLTAAERSQYLEILKTPVLYKAFPAYLCEHLSVPGPVYERALNLVLNRKLPDPRTGYLVKQYKRFMPEGGPGPSASLHGWRNYETFSLTTVETSQARQFMAANPEGHFALAVLQDALIAYLSRLKEEHRQYSQNEKFKFVKQDFSDDMFFRDYWYSTKDGHLSVVFDEFIATGNAFSFLHDLSPLMAHSFQQYGEITQKSLRHSLAGLFQKQAFRSDMRGAVRCPFSSHFAEVMSIALERDAQGRLRSSQGEFGDLLLFLIQQTKQTLSSHEFGQLKDVLAFEA